jgi:PmbA protein
MAGSEGTPGDLGALRRLGEFATARALRAGAREAAAATSWRRRTRIMVRDGRQEELSAAEESGLRLQVYVDGRYGSHRTSQLEERRLLAFIDEAVAMTRLLMPDEGRRLPDPALYQGRSTADLGLVDPVWESVALGERQALARAAFEAARAAGGGELISASGSLTDYRQARALVTTNGFADAEAETGWHLGAEVSLRDPSGRKPEDWAEASARRRGLLPDPAAVGAEAGERARAQLGASRLETRTLPIVIENRVVATLLRGLLAPLSARALDQRQSCFDQALGQAIAASFLTLTDDPTLPGGWGSRRFDEEGLTARRRAIVEGGKLASFLVDDYYGRKIGRIPNSGSTSNLVFSAGAEGLEALLGTAGTAVLITSFLGGNSNSTTGDFSLGLRGFLVENGRRVRPVASMNLAGNHTSFWKNLQAVGSDPWRHGSWRTPSLLFGPVTVAGGS